MIIMIMIISLYNIIYHILYNNRDVWLITQYKRRHKQIHSDIQNPCHFYKTGPFYHCMYTCHLALGLILLWHVYIPSGTTGFIITKSLYSCPTLPYTYHSAWCGWYIILLELWWRWIQPISILDMPGVQDSSAQGNLISTVPNTTPWCWDPKQKKKTLRAEYTKQ